MTKIAKQKVNSDEAPKYTTNFKSVKPDEVPNDDDVIKHALRILEFRLRAPGECLENPGITRDYLRLHLAELEHEVFGMLFLDNRHRVIQIKDLFRGTVDGASVHPREVVKETLAVNAVAVIMYHNHPSGVPEPSRADLSLTKRLKESLALVDIRVLDHIIVGDMEIVSFAERGLI